MSSLLETVSRQAAKIAHLENQLHDVTDKPLDPSLPDAVPRYSNISQASAGESGDNQSLVWFVFTYKELKNILLTYICRTTVTLVNSYS